MQTVTGHLMSNHTCHNHPRVDPCNQNDRLVEQQYKHVNRPTCILPTDTNLYVVAIRGVFKVVYGAHHVQGHVTDVMSMIFGLLWSPGYHHVGISNSLNLVKDRNICRYEVCVHSTLNEGKTQTNLEDAMLLAKRIKQRVHGVEHGDHLHWGDVTANASKSHDITEKNGHVWEHLGEER